MKPITLQGRPLAGGALPAVCIPLVSRGAGALIDEAVAAAAKRPDLLEKARRAGLLNPADEKFLAGLEKPV